MLLNKLQCEMRNWTKWDDISMRRQTFNSWIIIKKQNDSKKQINKLSQILSFFFVDKLHFYITRAHKSIKKLPEFAWSQHRSWMVRAKEALFFVQKIDNILTCGFEEIKIAVALNWKYFVFRTSTNRDIWTHTQKTVILMTA